MTSLWSGFCLIACVAWFYFDTSVQNILLDWLENVVALLSVDVYVGVYINRIIFHSLCIIMIPGWINKYLNMIKYISNVI